MHENLAFRILLRLFARRYNLPFYFWSIDYNLLITETEEAIRVTARDCMNSINISLKRTEINDIFFHMCYKNVNNISLLKQTFKDTIRYWANQINKMRQNLGKKLAPFKQFNIFLNLCHRHLQQIINQ